MVITEQQALEIAKQAGIPEPTELQANTVRLFTRALNLAAAMALEDFYQQQIKNGEWGASWQTMEIARRLISTLGEYRQAGENT